MATIQSGQRIWMYQLNPKRGDSFTAEELWETIEEGHLDFEEWYVTQNFKVAQVGDPVILRVNAGNKGDATGLVAFGRLSDVNVEDRFVTIRVNKDVTAKLMKKPVSLVDMRSVIIPKIQKNLGDVTRYRAQINSWIRTAGHRKPNAHDSLAEIVKYVGEDMGIEGSATVRTHMDYERDPRNRDRVLAKHTRPYECKVCGFSFDVYGGEYGQLIYVHHLKPLSSKGRAGRPRIQDFALLCANCHAVVHWKRGRKPLSPDQLRNLLARRRTETTSKSPKASPKNMAKPSM